MPITSLRATILNTCAFSALALGAAIFTPTGPALAEDITATAVAGHPPVFRWVKMIPEVFVPAVQKELEGTGHTFTITEQFGGSIAKVGEEPEAIGEGLAEIGTVSSLFDAAKLPVQNVTYYTPFVSSDHVAISNLIDRLHKEDPRMVEAYTAMNIVPLGAPIVIDDYLLMTTFPVNSLADLDGKKIAAPGPAINWLSGTGAVGVSGNLTTYYNELKTGVYDGVIVFASAALPGKLYEVAPYITRAGLGAQHSGVLGANKDWYDALPADVQNALRAGADAAKEWYNSDLAAFVTTSLETMAANGATVTEASPEMRQAWADGMDNVAQTWAADLDAKGIPASDILSLYMDEMREAGSDTAAQLGREIGRSWAVVTMAAHTSALSFPLQRESIFPRLPERTAETAGAATTSMISNGIRAADMDSRCSGNDKVSDNCQSTFGTTPASLTTETDPMIFRILDNATQVLNVAGTVLIVALMLLIGADVIGRGAFNSPVSGVPELVSLSIVAIVFLQVPQALRAGRFTRSDAILGWLQESHPGVARWLEVVFDIVAIALLGALLYASWPLFVKAWEADTYVGAVGNFTAPVWPVKLIIVIGTIMLILQFAARIARALGARGTPE